jgi:AcrR family transcriptional regulator
MNRTTPRLFAFYKKHIKKLPQQSRSRGLVDAIQTATLESIDRGKESVSLSEIATRAGVGLGSLYDYFRDRDDLVASVVAKVTEENLANFESLVSELEARPMSEGIVRLVDETLKVYVRDPRMSRAALKIAHRLDLMPMLVEGQLLFARALTRLIEKQGDPAIPNKSAAAYVVTQAVMGIVMAQVWGEGSDTTNEQVRATCIDMLTRYLASHELAKT